MSKVTLPSFRDLLERDKYGPGDGLAVFVERVTWIARQAVKDEVERLEIDTESADELRARVRELEQRVDLLAGLYGRTDPS